jgi:glycosyltransferase involved in cell wall biosynthesis
MKILYVGHTYTVRANHAKIAALARAMPQAQITLITPHAWRGPLYSNSADKFDRTLASNVDHRILRAHFIGKEGAYVYGPALFRFVARLKPDIVHVEQGAYALSYAQVLLATRLFSPHSKAVFFTWWNLPYRPQGIKRIAEKFNLKHSACAIAGNEAAKDILREHGFQRPIHVLPQLGIDSCAETESPLSRHAGDEFTIGYAGRIATEKGVLDLVNAVAEMPSSQEASFYFVGAGDALSEVKMQAAYRGVRLTHHAAVKNDELPSHLAKMDVLVLPSRTTPEWVEQFGHILLEAMALGIPVVGSSSGEIPNVIGDAGLIFPESDTSVLARHLELLLKNPAERERLAAAGKKRVAKHFTHEIIAREQARIYDWMLREGRAVGACKSNTLRGDAAMEGLTRAL